MDQLTIPFVKGSDTSKAAAKSMREPAPNIRAKIFGLISDRPLTCDEVEVTLDLRHQTASARIRELVEQGRIIDSKQRRKTRSGRNAVVYRVVED